MHFLLASLLVGAAAAVLATLTGLLALEVAVLAFFAVVAPASSAALLTFFDFFGAITQNTITQWNQNFDGST
jgi:hypothetical protein